jgi:hypothetical protein
MLDDIHAQLCSTAALHCSFWGEKKVVTIMETRSTGDTFLVACSMSRSMRAAREAWFGQ